MTVIRLSPPFAHTVLLLNAADYESSSTDDEDEGCGAMDMTPIQAVIDMMLTPGAKWDDTPDEADDDAE
jgi:hypothetical protein